MGESAEHVGLDFSNPPPKQDQELSQADMAALESFLSTGKMDDQIIPHLLDWTTLARYRQQKGERAFFHLLHGLVRSANLPLSAAWEQKSRAAYAMTEKEFFQPVFIADLVRRGGEDEQKTEEQRTEDECYASMVFRQNGHLIQKRLLAFMSRGGESSARSDGERQQAWDALHPLVEALWVWRNEETASGLLFWVTRTLMSDDRFFFPTSAESAACRMDPDEAIDLFSAYFRSAYGNAPELSNAVLRRFLATASAYDPKKAGIAIRQSMQALSESDLASIVPDALEAVAGTPCEAALDATILVRDRGRLKADVLSRLKSRGVEIDEKMLATWSQCSPRSWDSQCEYVQANVECMVALETRRPGSTAVLRKEFGMENFARYLIEQMVDQFDKRDDRSRRYGIAVYPKSDHNGAFWISNRPGGRADDVVSLRTSLADKFYLRIYEVGSRVGMARVLVGSKERYANHGAGKIAFAIIGGHGTKDSIRLGDATETTTLHATDLLGRGMGRAGGEYLEEGATILLRSCSTGAEGGIGQTLSRVLGVKVIAPDTPTYVEHMSMTSVLNGVPEFVVRYGKNESGQLAQTMSYESGI